MYMCVTRFNESCHTDIYIYMCIYVYLYIYGSEYDKKQ